MIKYFLRVGLLLGLVAFYLFLTQNAVYSLPPPDLVEERNSQAEELLIGKVSRITPSKLSKEIIRYSSPSFAVTSYFDLEILEVKRSSNNLKKGDVIKVVYSDWEDPIPLFRVHPLGPAPVRVEKGQVIELYANLKDSQQNIYEAALAGHSVKIIKDVSRFVKFIQWFLGGVLIVIGIIMTFRFFQGYGRKITMLNPFKFLSPGKVNLFEKALLLFQGLALILVGLFVIFFFTY